MIHVLGATGRLGRMLRWAWQDRNDVWWHGGRTNGDLLNPSQKLSAGLATAKVVVNLTGVTPAPDADLGLNTPLGLAPFSLAPEALILTASSAAVYGGSDEPHSEDEPLTANSEYGKAKIEMEREIRQAAKGRDHIIMRVGNVAGADQLLGGLTTNEPHLHRFLDGTTPQRSYIGPKGLADVIAYLITTPRPLPVAVNVAASLVSMDALLSAAGRSYIAQPAPKSLPPKVELNLKRLRSISPGLTFAQSPQDIVSEWTAFRESSY